MARSDGPAIGLDLGGTKIEAQVFGVDWSVLDRKRVPTPTTYDSLVEQTARLIGWARKISGKLAPVGLATAGLLAPKSGTMLTANLPATGHPFPDDLERAAGCKVVCSNDASALTLSEAVFGVGREHRLVVGLILGTGVGGGIASDGLLLRPPMGINGEFGHTPTPATVVTRHGLPIITCGCGRDGCIETYLAGRGFERLGRIFGASATTPAELAAQREVDEGAGKAWTVWLELLTELCGSIGMSIAPDAIVIGGGLSRIPLLAGSLSASIAERAWEGFASPHILIAEGGDASGARGAAFAAATASLP